MNILVHALTFLLVFTASAQEPAGRSRAETEQRVFVKAQRAGEDKWRSFFMFSAGGHDYTIRGDGRGESSWGKARPRSFNLKMDRGHLEQVYFLEYEGDLLLIYEVSNETHGWGYAARLSQSTVKTKWLTGVSGFNFGPALAESTYAYLTAADLVAKLDLGSGAYVWQQQLPQAKDSPSAQGFRAPRIEGDQLFLTEDLDPQRIIVVDKLSGKIVNIRE